jgi:hypothetical protein
LRSSCGGWDAAKDQKGRLSAGLLLALVFVLGFILATPVEDFPAQLSYSLGASFANFAHAFSGADADVLAGSRNAFAGISGGVARVQSSEIAGRSGSAFAQASRALSCAFANVLTTLAHVLAGAGPGFLVLIMRRGLRRGRSLILTWIRGSRDGGRTQ